MRKGYDREKKKTRLISIESQPKKVVIIVVVVIVVGGFIVFVVGGFIVFVVCGGVVVVLSQKPSIKVSFALNLARSFTAWFWF